MLKLIVMIDCNMCGQPFDRISASIDRDPMAWKCLSMDLEYDAERRGWGLSYGAHYCDWCVENRKLGDNRAGNKVAVQESSTQDNEIPF